MMMYKYNRTTEFLSEDNQVFLDEGGFDIQWEITYEEAETISGWIKDENKLHPHMVEKSPDFIFASSQEYGCIKMLDTANTMIGFMGLYKYGDIYEAGSLYVLPEFRNRGVAKMLQKNLLNLYDYPIFIVTSIEYAKRINKNTNLVLVTREVLHDDILRIIESGGKILSDDEVYINKCLLFNEKLLDLYNG